MELYIYPLEPHHSDDLKRLGDELYELDVVETVTAIRGKAEPERLGGGLVELLVVIFGAGGSLTVMVKAVVDLLKNRPSLKVKVSLGPDTKTVDVDVPPGTPLSELAGFVERIVRQLQRQELPETAEPGDDSAR